MSIKTLARTNRPAPSPIPAPMPLAPAVAGITVLSSAVLAACGGGGGSGGDAGALPPPPPAPTRSQASRFLGHATVGGQAADIERVQTLGYSAWLDEQFAMPQGASYLALMSPGGPDFDATYDDPEDGRNGVERAAWRKLISFPDALRQRVTFALTEIIVISIIPVIVANRGFASAAFMDILQTHAFGNYRDVLMQVSTSPAMGAYLSFIGNRKAAGGAMPDENYARELIQLFSIGTIKLALDGTPVVENGKVVETYTQEDVSQLARVFTGWVLSSGRPGGLNNFPSTRPLVQNAALHETGTKQFLGTTIPAGTDGMKSLELAIDTLMNHPNMGPFIGRQLIQRLVTSNPSPAYVARVAAAFNGDATRAKGDMKATLRAILTDDEALSEATLGDPTFGKLREPVLRFAQWARTFGLNSADDQWLIGNLSDAGRALAQSPLRSPSVFNFFRPGYVPPNSELGRRAITAPEFQITTESTVVAYLNYMQGVVSNGVAGKLPNYSALMPLVADSAALLNELNVLMAAGQISAGTLATLKTALDSIDTTTTAGQNNRLHAALTLVLAAPEYIIQK